MPAATVPRIQLIAHRGYARHYPENTLRALREAVAAGARFVEFDVQLSADRMPVLLHDNDLMRTGNVDLQVFEQLGVDLMQCSVGEPARFGTRFADEKLPSLAQAVDWLVQQPQVTAFVEVKTESIRHFGAQVVQHAVTQRLEAVRRQVVLISYDDAFLFAARLAAPMPIGWVVPRWDEAHARRARALAPDYLLIDWERLPEPPAPLWQGEWRWVAFEVTDAELALRLAGRGVAFAETVAIAELLADARLAAAGV